MSDHSKVAPTAWGVAYLRTMTDIPMAETMFRGLESQLEASGESSPAWKGDRDHLAPQLEARYKLVERLLRATGCNQVLELASGMATHGINTAQANPVIQYVELDLPGVTKQKRAVLKAAGIGLPPNLKIINGDVLDPSDIKQATTSFDKSKNVAIMNEGLLRYLTFAQKKQVANNVRGVLEVFGGNWVTPDVSLQQAMAREDERAKGHTANIAMTTGIDLSKNVFRDEQHARDFFEGLGFTVDSHTFLEVTDELVSPVLLGMSDEEVIRLNEPCVAFVMTLAEE